MQKNLVSYCAFNKEDRTDMDGGIDTSEWNN